MNHSLPYPFLGATLSLDAWPMKATTLTISLMGSDPMTRNTVKCQCDRQAGALGLPTGVFPVEYLNGNGNSLAVLPIQGQSLIFANLLSGSGARRASVCSSRFAVRKGADRLSGSPVERAGTIKTARGKHRSGRRSRIPCPSQLQRNHAYVPLHTPIHLRLV